MIRVCLDALPGHLLHFLGLRVQRVGEGVWEGRVNRLIMVGLGALGASQLAATGTLGGHLHGAPAYLSELMRVFGWDVYHTFYTPTWVLLLLAVVIVVMPALAIVTTRGRAVRPQRQEAGK